MCFQNPDIKYLAQKSLASYAKSIYIQKDRDVFKLESLDLDALATAIGLPGLPQIKYQKGEDVKRLKNAPRMHWSSGSETGSDADNQKEKRPRKGEVRTKYDRMFERTNQDVLSSHYTKLIDHNMEGSPESQADEDADFLTVKRVLDGEGLDKASGHPGEALRVVDLGGTQPLVIDSKRREKMLKSG
jgi:ATP-dependent RNA helicase DDX10/DBP4